MRLVTALLTVASTLALISGNAAAQDSKADFQLPDTLVWTAYDVGSAGYNQAVGVGSVLKNKHGVNLRVLPGKNDVSRLAPLVAGKADFAATGSDSTYAQEAIYTFGLPDWGPKPIRLVMINVAASASRRPMTSKASASPG